MQIVLMAPFLLSFRIAGTSLDGAFGEQLRTAVRTGVPGIAVNPVEPRSPMLFDHHQSTGGTRLSGAVTRGSVQVPGVGPVLLRFDPSGVAYVIHTVDVPNRDDMHRREREIASAMRPYVARWAGRVSELMLAGGRVAPAHPEAMDPCKLLWWHRVLIDPQPGEEPAATRTYGVQRTIHDDAYCRIGDGFTTLVNVPERRIAEVLNGLCSATEEWFAVDEANRLVAARLRQLEDSSWRSTDEVDEQFRESLRLSKELSLRELVRMEEDRYIVNAGGLVKEAALEIWRTDREKAALEVQLQSLRDILDFHRTMTQYRRDERRNRLLFVFTAITLLQSVLLWYDFATSDDTQVSSALRLWIDGVVGLLTMLVLAVALLDRRRP